MPRSNSWLTEAISTVAQINDSVTATNDEGSPANLCARSGSCSAEDARSVASSFDPLSPAHQSVHSQQSYTDRYVETVV
jgi:hypothetical protein